MLEWHIGNVIGRILESRNLNINEVAPKADLSAYHLGQIIKTGKTTTTSLGNIATALELSVGDLYCELDLRLKNKYGKSTAASICPDNNPEHISYHQIFEDLLNGDPAIAESAITILKALTLKSRDGPQRDDKIRRGA